jgi:glycosyltransferase involved in cell wall biosynthesis
MPVSSPDRRHSRRIGVNALYLIPGGVGGTEIYLRALLAALASIDQTNEYFIFTNRETGADLVPKAENFARMPQGVRAVNRPARLIWEQTALPLAARHLRLDVLLNPGFTAPLLAPCPQVTVFHDMQHKRHPEYFRWFDLPFWRFFLYWSARRSDRLITVSDATTADLLRFYPGTPKSKIRVVPHGVDPEFARLRERRAPEKFLLAASTLHPHKNLDGLLRAFAIFRKSHPDFRLIVCGMHGFFTGPLHDLRAQLGLTDAVEFPGWIPRAQVYDLFARAWAFVYPTRFEGFGLPILESLAAGIPTACSAIEPLIGLAGGAAATFPPDDPAAMARSMEAIVEDDALRGRLSAAGPVQAARFSWEAAARGTLDALLG